MDTHALDHNRHQLRCSSDLGGHAFDQGNVCKVLVDLSNTRSIGRRSCVDL
jgi:hypothetical protein